MRDLITSMAVNLGTLTKAAKEVGAGLKEIAEAIRLRKNEIEPGVFVKATMTDEQRNNKWSIGRPQYPSAADVPDGVHRYFDTTEGRLMDWDDDLGWVPSLRSDG